MTYEILYKNAQTLNELTQKYNDLKNKTKTKKDKDQLKKLRIYMLSILKNMEDLTE